MIQIILAFGTALAGGMSAFLYTAVRSQNRRHARSWRPNVGVWRGKMGRPARAWLGAHTRYSIANPPKWRGGLTRHQRGNPPTWRGRYSPNAVGIQPSRKVMRTVIRRAEQITIEEVDGPSAGRKPLGWVGPWKNGRP